MTYPTTVEELELLRAVKRGDNSRAEIILDIINISKLNDERYFDYHLVVKALQSGLTNLAKLFIKKGFRIYNEFEVQRTILEYAVRLGDKGLITTLLAKGASPDILTSNNQNKTPFHLAIDRNQLSTIDLFSSHYDVKTFEEKDLLHYAIEHDKILVVVTLIENGFSLQKRNEKNMTPFCTALRRNNTIVDYLLSHISIKNIKLDNSDDIAPAYIACISGNLELVKNYIDFGLSINNTLKWNTEAWSCLDDYSGYTLLHCAVKHFKLDIVEFLLSAGADICVQDANGSTPLHIAFETTQENAQIKDLVQKSENNNSIIELLLKANRNFKSNPINQSGLSHFHIVCSGDEPSVVKYFLKLGTPINEPVRAESHVYKGYSPLHFAAKFKCIKTLELLLKNKADVKQCDFYKMTALHIAAREGSLDGVHLLLQYGADTTSTDSHGNTPLHLAFEKNNYAIIDLLLSVHNVTHSNLTNSEGLSHFHIVCTRSNVNLVKSFIKSGVSINSCVSTLLDKEEISDWSGYSSLHFATSFNKAKIVQLLLQNGADVGIKNSKGLTSLHIACQFTYNMFKEFLKNSLDNLIGDARSTEQLEAFNSYSTNLIGKINWSTHRKDHLKIINSLLNYGSDVNSFDNNGNTPLFYVYATVNEMLCSLKKNLIFPEPIWTQIFASLSKEFYERRRLILNNLLKLNANLDQCYKNGSILNKIFTKYDDKKDAEIIEMFLKKGADVNVYDDKMLTPLHHAIMMRNVSLITMLLELGANVDCIRPEDNLTPLLIVTSEPMSTKNCIIANKLIDKGANVNAKRSDGSTVLHTLPLLNDICHNEEIVAVISALVKAGANVNIRDSKGFTPLHSACSATNYFFVDVLLKHGADVSAEDNEGRSVCCYLYEKHLINTEYGFEFYVRCENMITYLKIHIIAIYVIARPSLSSKALLSRAKHDDFLLRTEWDNRVDEQRLIDECEAEVQSLRDKKITANCTLYDVVFKSENSLSKLVKNKIFKSIVQSKSFEETYYHYGYLIRLKYQEGVYRGNLLPIATSIINNLAGQHLPDACTENICKYFTNYELKECTTALACFLDCNANNNPDDNNMVLRSRGGSKRQKVF